MADELSQINAAKIQTDALKLKHWKDIAINKDINGRALLRGHQPEVAIGLGMVAQDQYPEFNELMKNAVAGSEAKELDLSVKVGYKKGVVRIWQKLAEYDAVSPLK